MTSSSTPYRIIAVCTGNICRSPMAQVMLAAAFRAKGFGEMPGAYARLLGRIEEAEILDGAVDRARPLAAKLTARERMRSVLHGDATGIPMHAILTDLPFGAWWMAVFLDLFPDAGSCTASTRLVALGIASAVPWAARIKGRHHLGVQLGRAGTIFLLVSGFLGGHMGSGRRATPNQQQMPQQVRSIS